MKVILSRKGFDSSYGGCASPILPDGTMLSMPIPGGEASNLKFEDIKYGEITYLDIWDKLYSKHKTDKLYCHLDPDIRADVRVKPVDNWVAAFGQTDTAQKHLHNRGVSKGDLFLFFGWFRKTDENYKYLPDDMDKQIIYGYLQIGDIVNGDEIKNNYPWHPHAKGKYSSDNTLYVATEKLTLDGKETDLPGYGVFKYNDELVLTKDNCSRSKWKINSDWNIEKFFESNSISYHSKNNIKDSYFQSAYRGQEFIISENKKVNDWAYNLIKNNA
jgi:hypothetical protein